jgi:hypothetical protein
LNFLPTTHVRLTSSLRSLTVLTAQFFAFIGPHCRIGVCRQPPHYTFAHCPPCMGRSAQRPIPGFPRLCSTRASLFRIPKHRCSIISCGYHHVCRAPHMETLQLRPRGIVRKTASSTSLASKDETTDSARFSRKFGKHIQKRQLEIPEYAASFVDYKALKKVIWCLMVWSCMCADVSVAHQEAQ